MIYELYRMGKTRAKDTYLTHASSLVNARKKAMGLYTGKAILIIRSSNVTRTECGYVAKNGDGFFYRNLEDRMISGLKADGTVIRYG